MLALYHPTSAENHGSRIVRAGHSNETSDPAAAFDGSADADIGYPLRRMLKTINLLTLDEDVAGPDNIVYSTSPQTATVEDGTKYFVKGPDPIIAFAELAGCLLAQAVGLVVAPVSVCCFESDKFCGSQEVATIGRNVAPWLDPKRTTNFQDLYAAVVVDVWLANIDRNLGNVVARGIPGGKAELVFIDFEKSAALRPNPRISPNMIPPAQLWPSGELGDILRRAKPLHPPAPAISKIQAFVKQPQGVQSIIRSVCAQLEEVEWWDGSVDTVISRGSAIQKLAGEVWDIH